MKRRSFLKILAGVACAVAAGIELALPNDTKPVVDVRPPKYEINPAWLDAKYEVEYLIDEKTFRRLMPPSELTEPADQILSIRRWSSLPDPDYDALDEERYNEYLREA